jgi:signal recognition particle subunit SRP54
MSKKLKKAQFDFEDYLESMQQMKKLGGLSSVMNMMPGMNMGKMKDVDLEEGDKQLKRIESIIYSMTIKERQNPDILNPSRKHRIAKGAGVDIREVNRMVKQFKEMKKMMKQFGKPGKRRGFRMPF